MSPTVQAPERWSQLQSVVQNVFGETCETEAHSGGGLAGRFSGKIQENWLVVTGTMEFYIG